MKIIGLKNKIESSEFVLLLTIWENILRLLYTVSKLLQSPNTTVHQACELLENCFRSIKSLRIREYILMKLWFHEKYCVQNGQHQLNLKAIAVCLPKNILMKLIM